MAGTPTPASGNDDPVWRFRWLLLASSLLVASAVTTFVVFLPTTWHWAPLWWGLAATIAWLGVRQAGFAVLLRRDDIPAERRDRFRRRDKVLIPECIVIGGAVSVFAAKLGSIWIVVAMAAFMFLSIGAGFILAAVVLRRRDRAAGAG